VTDTVLVTGIGGNVAQGVLRVIRSLGRDVRLVGTNTEAVSGGNHLCDAVHAVPYAVDPRYPAALRDVVAREGVRLIVPCTDAETVVLARERASLPPVAVSSEETCRTFYDKARTAEALDRAGLPFARSWLPRAWDGTRPCIVKPREGRGSRGIAVDPPDPRAWSDEFLVQELLTGDEITVAAYIDRSGKLHGFVAMRRELHAGATVRCEVTRAHDAVLGPLLAAFGAAFPLRGSFNVQAIVDQAGRAVPFEVNCRISGTASIRHHFGFRDVEWTLAEFLDGSELAPMALRTGSAVRLLMDVVYPDRTLDEPRDRSSPHVVF
jgi:carbamoyl-phosphate synthase large subunit